MSKTCVLESELDDLILNVTEKAFNAIPKETLEILPEGRREEFFYDLSEAVEASIRDHFPTGSEEFLEPIGEQKTSTALDKTPTVA
jgi:hypothetical protein